MPFSNFWPYACLYHTIIGRIRHPACHFVGRERRLDRPTTLQRLGEASGKSGDTGSCSGGRIGAELAGPTTDRGNPAIVRTHPGYLAQGSQSRTPASAFDPCSGTDFKAYGGL